MGDIATHCNHKYFFISRCHVALTGANVHNKLHAKDWISRFLTQKHLLQGEVSSRKLRVIQKNLGFARFRKKRITESSGYSLRRKAIISEYRF